MSTHASAGRQWTDEELQALTVEGSFRLRGLEVTRLDTFVDAAFAFVLTLLVISFDELPESYAEMLEAIKRIPAFAVSFAMLMVFWLEHRSFSRRYGLENPRTLVLSLSLIFTVLVYVFPLRTIAAGMFAQMSGGLLPSGFSVQTYEELRGLFLFYSAGFLAMSMILCLLQQEALRAADALGLDARERIVTGADRNTWIVCMGVGGASVALALLASGDAIVLAGWVYWLLGVTIPLVYHRCRRRLAALEAESGG